MCETIVQKGITVDNAALLLATADSLPHARSMQDLCLRCVAPVRAAVAKCHPVD